jgi:hypothetical protein
VAPNGEIAKYLGDHFDHTNSHLTLETIHVSVIRIYQNYQHSIVAVL